MCIRDSANTVKVIHNLDRHIRTIGIDTPADYRAVHVREYRPSFFCFDVQVLGCLLYTSRCV